MINPSYRLKITFQLILLLVSCVFGHREHKVHNITLYPDKHSWCHVLPIKQVISYSGCKSVEIDNNVCVGACFSYSIPHTEPSDPGEVIVPYCDSCQPSETEWRHVELECDKSDPDAMENAVKRVQIIKNCSCTACEKDEYLQQKLLGHKADELLQTQNDIPDLLNVLNKRNETVTLNNQQHSKDLKLLLNHHIITLLKNIQSDNSQKDKEQLMDALRIVQGNDSSKKINDKSLIEFVDSLNTENIELDIPKLREILTKFEQSKNYEKHRKSIKYRQHQLNDDDIYDNGDDNNSNNDDDDDDDDNENNNKEDDIQTLLNINGQHHNQNRNNGLDEIEGSHLAMGHLKGSHIGMGLRDPNDNDDDDSKNYHPHPHAHAHHHHHHNHHETTTSDSVTIDNNNENKHLEHYPHHKAQNHHHHHHQHHPHHHIGENIVDHGHLIRGPHNSLVIAPDNLVDPTTANKQKHQHEKLDVNAHELKPNHAGTLLTYSSHSENGKKTNLKK